MSLEDAQKVVKNDDIADESDSGDKDAEELGSEDFVQPSRFERFSKKESNIPREVFTEIEEPSERLAEENSEEIAVQEPEVDDNDRFYESIRKYDILYIPIDQLNQDVMIIQPVKDIESPIYLGVYAKRSDHKGSKVFTTLYIDKSFLAGVINNKMISSVDDLVTVKGFSEDLVAKADNIQIDEGRIVWHDGQWKINRKSVVNLIMEL